LPLAELSKVTTTREISPAAWPLRLFNIEGLVALLASCQPKLVELSKDFVENVSLKSLAAELSPVRQAIGADLAYAGTTDFVTCAGFAWDRYRNYLSVQIAQAKFLECSFFRLLVGKPDARVPAAEVLKRLQSFFHDCAPMSACIEIHGGLESEPAFMDDLLANTSASFVVDFENARRARLSSDDLLARLIPDRIAYFHQRNLPDVWIEHQETLEDERKWLQRCPRGTFLWEPKTVSDPKRIEELLREYRSNH
jgi:hypothetical protein